MTPKADRGLSGGAPVVRHGAARERANPEVAPTIAKTRPSPIVRGDPPPAPAA